MCGLIWGVIFNSQDPTNCNHLFPTQVLHYTCECMGESLATPTLQQLKEMTADIYAVSERERDVYFVSDVRRALLFVCVWHLHQHELSLVSMHCYVLV